VSETEVPSPKLPVSSGHESTGLRLGSFIHDSAISSTLKIYGIALIRAYFRRITEFSEGDIQADSALSLDLRWAASSGSAYDVGGISCWSVEVNPWSRILPFSSGGCVACSSAS
jgi:hypothetical protein